jgi:DNA mismatch repair protein MutS2
MQYNPHALRVLEFDRVLEIAVSLADSAEGKRAVAALAPLDDLSVIRERLAECDELMNALRFDDPMPGIAVHDIRELFPILQVEGSRLEIEGIAAVAENLGVARAVHGYFADRGSKYPLVGGIVSGIVPHEDIERRIHKAITPDLTVADDATPELRSIRRRLEQARASLRSLVERTLDTLSDDVVGERTITLRDGRFVIPVRDSMKSKVPGAVHDRSQTGRTLFIEPIASIEGNNQVRELELAEQEEVDRILRELTSLIAGASFDIHRNQEILVRVDIILAKARYGARVEGSIPRLYDTPRITIVRGRHPLLDWKFRKRADGSAAVPMNLDLGEDAVTAVLTGPNAGGKTVVLKTVGLLTVMALSGIPVPAGEGTTVCIPSGIFADIGDEQSIEDDLSTFSSHMKQIVTILREAAPGSLVLLDELGGGTNPSDGEAIALAVLRTLTSRGALTIATTHLGALKVFAHETKGAVNASMEFDREHLRPTFVLRSGIPGSSYAFEIASRMGMPDSVLREAETIAGGERKSLENLIAEMEEHVRIADAERRTAEAARIIAESERASYEKKLGEFAEKRREMLGEAVEESRRIMESANRSIESAIRLIKEGGASRETIREAKALVKREVEAIAAKSGELNPKAEKQGAPPGGLHEGMRVRVDSLDAEAVVEQVLDGGRKARILVGRSKASLVVDAMDLSAAEKSEARPPQTVRVSSPSGSAETNEIDVRGLTFEEARDEIDPFLDRLHLSGMETAHIIHGKGSGALRSKIGAWLDKHPHVESHRLGNWNEGSFGVTVATLRK